MRYGFFDAEITGYDANNMPLFDRAEDSEFFARFMSACFNTGIFLGEANGLRVTAAGGLGVEVGTGCCVLAGRFGWQSEASTLTLVAAHQTLNRRDRIVIRLSYTNRTITPVVLTGTPGATVYPAPSITRNGNNFDISLATVVVAAGATQLNQAAITDTRSDTTVCGYVSVPVEGLTNHINNAAVHVTAEQKTAWNGHKDSTANPHGVTAAQAEAIPLREAGTHLASTVTTLNSVTAVGSYSTYLNYASIQNKPVNERGLLYVECTNRGGGEGNVLYKRQRYITDSGAEYWRSTTNGGTTWTAWVKNTNLTPADIGAMSGAVTTLWSGSASSGNITLSQAYTNFKQILFITVSTENSGNYCLNGVYPTSGITQNRKYATGGSYGVFVTFTSGTNVALGGNVSWASNLVQVLGVK